MDKIRPARDGWKKKKNSGRVLMLGVAAVTLVYNYFIAANSEYEALGGGSKFCPADCVCCHDSHHRLQRLSLRDVGSNM